MTEKKQSPSEKAFEKKKAEKLAELELAEEVTEEGEFETRFLSKLGNTNGLGSNE